MVGDGRVAVQEVKMLIVGIVDCPSPESFGVVPFIVRTDDNRLLVTGHAQSEVDEERLQWLFKNPIGAHDVSAVGARIALFERTLIAGWVGDQFVSECTRLGVPAPDHPEAWYVRAIQGCFWVGPHVDVRACRQRWILAAGRAVIRTRDRALARLMLEADPWAPEREAAAWYTRDTEEDRDAELQWFSQVIIRGRRRTKAQVEAEIHATIARLKED